MGLVVLILLIVVPLLLLVALIKRGRIRDGGYVFLIFGVMLITIMYLFIPGFYTCPILKRKVVLYSRESSENNEASDNNLLGYSASPMNTKSSQVYLSYKAPLGLGIGFIGVGALLLLLMKNRTPHINDGQKKISAHRGAVFRQCSVGEGEAYCLGCETIAPKTDLFFNEELDSYYHKECIPKEYKLIE